jgi:hypothetical protein
MSTATLPLRDAWQRDGFVPAGRVLDDATLAGLRDEEQWLRTHSPEIPASTKFYGLVARHCPTLRRLALGGPHLDVVEQLVGPDLVLWWNQFVTKMPDADPQRGQFRWHQDNGYQDVQPGTNLTIWIALDDVDTGNGCVWVVPGSHRNGLLPHNRPNADSWHLETPVADQGIPVPLKAGHAVMFSGYMLHRSLANASDRPRRALFLQYAPAGAMRFKDGVAQGLVEESTEAWVVRGRTPLGRRTHMDG